MSNFKLRNYQLNLVNSAYREFLDGKNGVVVVSPTGSGKMTTLTRMAQRSKRRVLLLFHVRELVNQCCEWLDNWGADYDIIMSGNYKYEGKRIAVATMQTYYRRREKIQHDYEAIIIDEGHHAKANTYERIFDMMPDAKRTAFTATPIRLDGLGLVDNNYFDAMVTGLTAKNLVDKGFLAPIRMFTQPCAIDFSDIKVTAGDYNQKEVAEVMESIGHGKIMGDAVKYYKKYLNGKPGLACCSSVRHAEMVAQTFNDNGITAVSIDGKTKKDVRQEQITDYKNGKIKVITYCKVFGEGVDLPDAAGMFYMQPSKSLSNWRQNCGRVSRKPYEGKEAFVFDHVGQAYVTFAGEPMGHPYREIDWLQLIYTQQENKRAKPNSKVPKVYDRCDDCLHVYDATLQKCPDCGYNNKAERQKQTILEEIEGELQERREIDAALAKGLDNLKTLDEFHSYAKAKGYKPGWAWFKFKELVKNR